MKRMNKAVGVFALAMALTASLAGVAAAQVTTGSISGSTVDETGGVLPGAAVTALHGPSGTKYETVSRGDGAFSLPGMRVGGPYAVTVAMSGFQTKVTTGLYVSLGVATDLKVILKTQALAEEVTVTAESDPVFSSGRTGAATAVSRNAIATLPTQSDRIDSCRPSPAARTFPSAAPTTGSTTSPWTVRTSTTPSDSAPPRATAPTWPPSPWPRSRRCR
jgi:hypothetical protein